MKRTALVFITLFTLATTGLILPRTHGARPSRTASLHGTLIREHTKNRELLASEAGWRYRQGQPTHWRNCLLHHKFSRSEFMGQSDTWSLAGSHPGSPRAVDSVAGNISVPDAAVASQASAESPFPARFGWETAWIDLGGEG